MTNIDFDRWLKQHWTLYPGVQAWMDKLPRAQLDGILEAWRAVLGSVSYEACIQASRQLYEAEEQPRAFDRHAAEVKARARKIQWGASPPPATSSSGLIRCRNCSDTGMTTIYGYSNWLADYLDKYGLGVVDGRLIEPDWRDVEPAERERWNNTLARFRSDPPTVGCWCSCDAGERLVSKFTPESKPMQLRPWMKLRASGVNPRPVPSLEELLTLNQRPVKRQHVGDREAINREFAGKVTANDW